uniref:Uncharacterized protein n=1 Tax=Moniliophthora roreri TaxID=221103 RepID=A0A0W0FMA9_MONRR
MLMNPHMFGQCIYKI